MSKDGYQNIPLNLLIYTTKESLYTQCQLYCYMKSQAVNGTIVMDRDLIQRFIKIAAITERTFRKLKKNLLISSWIYQIDKKQKKYIILAFSKLCKKIPHITTQGAIYEPLDFIHFESFACASVIKFYGIKKSYFERMKVLTHFAAYS